MLVRQVLWLPVQWEISKMRIHFADKRGVSVSVSRSALKRKNDQIDLESPHFQFSAPIPYSIRACSPKRYGRTPCPLYVSDPAAFHFTWRKKTCGGELCPPSIDQENQQKEPQKAIGQKDV